jgi:predicted DNA-binding transcriptional regulator AlpA
MRKIMDVDQVLAVVPVSRRTLLRWEQKQRFPAARMMGGKKIWFEEQIADWQDSLPPYTSLARRIKLVKEPTDG